MHDLQYSSNKAQTVGSISYSQQKNDSAAAAGDEDILVQSLSKRKLISASRSRLLLVAFTSLAVAYLLLICFRFIKTGRLVAPQSRSLADHYDVSCDLGDATGDSYNRDGRTTGGTHEHRAKELRNEGTLSPHYQIHGVHDSDTNPQGAGDAASIGEKTYGSSSGCWAQEFQQYDLDLWANRNMPEPIKGRLLNLFSRMVRASKLCRSLLPMLTSTQRLHLTYVVMRLIALDLGAISLVREDMEPARQSVGDSLISLGHECLEGNGSGAKYEGLRPAIRELIALVDKLKLPRRVQHEYDSLKYRKKMSTMMGTAGMVLKNCLGVLEGLLQSSCGDSLELPYAVVQQQIGVLEALYRVHASHINRDRPLRKHIIECQEQTGTHELLSYQLAQTSYKVIPKLRDLQKQMREAVSSAGGLLLLQQPNARQSHGTSRRFVGKSQLREAYPEALHGQRGQHHMLQGSSAAAEQQALHFAASLVSENVYGGPSLPSSAYPLWQPWQPPYQGHESAAQPVPQGTSSPWNQQSQSVSSPSLQASGGSAMPWMHTAHQRIQGAGPRLSLAPSLLARPYRLWATQSADSAFSLGRLQRHTPSGCVVQAPLGPTAQLRQRAGAEQPVTFESPPASSRRVEYSPFRQGSSPSLLPFTRATVSSLEMRKTSGCGRAGNRRQGVRRTRACDPDKGESSREAGRYGECRL
ncbi:hypothetical protein ETH_00018590 [Eimeria tenella]|uniref:Uncharacterized protein n=1 Tax=Eimeria tenella TaxID=5802 RepID=U6L1K7_EIMTE|nr:hypothetical protein ETH_00018590 [Eimeria tenella]CDJ42459.1 hypothetical protein ETH_00018590 [Eimeria tenella]|eukprot:XP_013233209.1 hypothetical protein ETH_00018590 [Eimeria tenella]